MTCSVIQPVPPSSRSCGGCCSSRSSSSPIRWIPTTGRRLPRKASGLLLRLLLGRYKFGARSSEAVIEASRASDRIAYGLPELIAPSAARIHAEWRVELERRIDQIRKEKGLRAVW